MTEKRAPEPSAPRQGSISFIRYLGRPLALRRHFHRSLLDMNRFATASEGSICKADPVEALPKSTRESRSRNPGVVHRPPRFLLQAQVINGAASSATWTFPTIIFSAMLIAWGAEAAQFLMAQGLALAILAWLQTMPEFAVEAVIAWEAGRDPNLTHLMIANLTGSLRLLVGLGWPMIYCTAAIMSRRRGQGPLKEIELEKEHAVEVVGLATSIAYFFIVYLKQTLAWYDAIILIGIYGAYLVVLRRIPPQDEEKMEDMEFIPRLILRQRRSVTVTLITVLFLGGGVLLYFTAHPFLQSMLALATGLGISTFVFVQWVAPFLSEFPEKVSAFYWARKISGAPMALMNMVSSNINQWTMLAAMLPLVFGWSHGAFVPIHLDAHQRLELLLTISQSLLGVLLLANMRFSWYEAAGIFTLWLIQFVFSGYPESIANAIKTVITVVYFAWSAGRVLICFFRAEGIIGFSTFPVLVRQYWSRSRTPP